jgi:hypothetical protein
MSLESMLDAEQMERWSCLCSEEAEEESVYADDAEDIGYGKVQQERIERNWE